MKLHYQGKYNLDPEILPKRKHQPNAVNLMQFIQRTCCYCKYNRTYINGHLIYSYSFSI